MSLTPHHAKYFTHDLTRQAMLNKLRYMLNVDTRGSQSLLNQAFTDPTAYLLKVKRPGSDESREVNVDLLETFNRLIGLTVKHIAAPLVFSAAFDRDSEKRLRLRGFLERHSANDSEFDLIYVNGGNNLENLETPDDTWNVRLIEADFHRLMFEAEGA